MEFLPIYLGISRSFSLSSTRVAAWQEGQIRDLYLDSHEKENEMATTIDSAHAVEESGTQDYFRIPTNSSTSVHHSNPTSSLSSGRRSDCSIISRLSNTPLNQSEMQATQAPAGPQMNPTDLIWF